LRNPGPRPDSWIPDLDDGTILFSLMQIATKKSAVE